ncbi:uncharacterized protein LOC112349893 [Selaginella moellendorffii]|uniref:uncharacterized protein LOC112349893 n=1 Tax=Selaginella moellendorffii TaxID=88036 RepID=UPI000D1CAA3F|nr:uncharacterized protein LOC112349893 [Selaginella moellendorffii]|eukprot:XP_024540866.1 uncharacterized protein LOC112349893 [Selaginella moellendorffii]
MLDPLVGDLECGIEARIPANSPRTRRREGEGEASLDFQGTHSSTRSPSFLSVTTTTTASTNRRNREREIFKLVMVWMGDGVAIAWIVAWAQLANLQKGSLLPIHRVFLILPSSSLPLCSCPCPFRWPFHAGMSSVSA